MTRLYDSPDPVPGKLLEMAIAAGMLLWLESLEEREKTVWIHTRRWERSNRRSPILLVGLVLGEVAIELYHKPGDSNDEIAEAVRDDADSYLRRVLRSGIGFTHNIGELAEDLARNLSSCITIHSNIQGGSWYVLGTTDTMRAKLLSLRESAAYARFIDRFKERYPQIVARLEKPRDTDGALEKAVSDLCDRYEALVRERLAAAV